MAPVEILPYLQPLELEYSYRLLIHINADMATFFTLALQFADLNAVNMKLQPEAAGGPIIAVVDDDPAVCNSLKFSLELEGFVVKVYRSAAEFLAADQFSECGCLVIDQRMPEMSGMELIAHLRKREVATPVILIVSHLNAALSARAENANVPIIEKPLLSNALVEKIREVCRCG